MTPATNLIGAAAVAVILILLFRPRSGVLWTWLAGRHAKERIRVEDALKHFYDCEFLQSRGTVNSLAGALQISRDDAARLTARLTEMKLLSADDSGLQLTAEGRSYALRVIRTHRLWEQYLADQTGVNESEWHDRADQQEHLLTPGQADRLSAQLGNPRFDPHGDPIPTADGVMPQRRGQPLTSMEAGVAARIVHVEDEPESVYAQLLAARLFPGMIVRVLEKTLERIRVEAEAQEHVLAPIVAANVTVEQLTDPAPLEARCRRLSSLRVGEQANVVQLSPSCKGLERRRLLDLGVVPGTRVAAELSSPGGDLVGYRIRGAVIALRREQADGVLVGAQDAAPTPTQEGGVA